MKTLLLAVLVLVVTGCTNQTYELCQAKARIERYEWCINHLPAGPVQTRYNDWDEVIDQCDITAYYQSNDMCEYLR